MEYLFETNAAIGHRMRQVRNQARMTQEQLADHMGISVNYLGEIERGRKPLSRTLADQFCSFFHVTYDYLYHGIPPASRYEIREHASYQSVHTSLVDQLSGCSHKEILIISNLVDSYLEISRRLQNQEIPHDDAGRQDYAEPKNRPPQPS